MLTGSQPVMRTSHRLSRRALCRAARHLLDVRCAGQWQGFTKQFKGQQRRAVSGVLRLELQQLQRGRQVRVAEPPAAEPQAAQAGEVAQRRPQHRVGPLRVRRVGRPQRQLRERGRQRRRVPAGGCAKTTPTSVYPRSCSSAQLQPSQLTRSDSTQLGVARRRRNMTVGTWAGR